MLDYYIIYFIFRNSFSFDNQFSCLTRFIIDQTQTPNLKVSETFLVLSNKTVLFVVKNLYRKVLLKLIMAKF